MKLIYNGRLRTGTVKFPNGSSLNVVRGTVYEIEDSLAKKIIGREWESVEKKIEVKTEEVNNKKLFKKTKEDKSKW